MANVPYEPNVKGLGLAFLVSALISVACETSPPPTVHASPSASISPGGWLQGSKPVDERVIQTFLVAGSDHCPSLNNATYLVMGWPLGQRSTNSSDERWYVRNPSPAVKYDLNALLAEYSPDVSPPADARYTNYHNSTFELWLAASDQDVAVYIATAGHIERWPRSKFALGCK
jgi:hypothetical protein